MTPEVRRTKLDRPTAAGILAAVGLSALVIAQPNDRPDYPITPVPPTSVTITDAFWKPRMERNRSVTIPHIFRQNEITGRIDNFLKAAGKKTGAYTGQRYNDTDIYKALEAASYVLATADDPALRQKVDDVIAIVAAAQEPDGYLYTPRSVDPKNPAPGAGPERWSYLHTSHELYDMGHMIEAAVAHHQATGSRALLDVGIKAADLIVRVFGPDRRRDVPGHQEIEIALVRLHRVTGDEKYLRTAKFFLDQRGREHGVTHATFEKGNRFFMYNDRSYRQDHVPVVEQTRATGHAVRATYMFAAMTDAAALTADPAFGRTVEGAFDDITSKRFYLTGGLGSQGATEAFGDDYVLPNRRAYAETCASIGGMLWYQRMFQRTGDAKYIDTLERTLYNGYLSGVSASGDRFFYQNPLESEGKPARVPYFDVACCPANLARLMAQLPGLVYASRGDTLYVNLFVGSDASATLNDTRVRVAQRTGYPWDGRVRLEVTPDERVTGALAIRIPGWARGEAMPTDLYRFAAAPPVSHSLSVNGRPFEARLDKGYAVVGRTWRPGDVVEIDLPMPVRRVLSHERVEENRGKVALQRGPVVYCVEAVDHGGSLAQVGIPADLELTPEFRPDLLGGLQVIRGKGVLAIPYFAWNNRGQGAMAVWVKGESTK